MSDRVLIENIKASVQGLKGAIGDSNADALVRINILEALVNTLQVPAEKVAPKERTPEDREEMLQKMVEQYGTKKKNGWR